ncbi:hypothetical protein LINPERPRIM_LOCUS39213 [Linum perenne]
MGIITPTMCHLTSWNCGFSSIISLPNINLWRISRQ